MTIKRFYAEAECSTCGNEQGHYVDLPADYSDPDLREALDDQAHECDGWRSGLGIPRHRRRAAGLMTTSNGSRAWDTSIEPRLLDSSNYQDVCPDCGTATVGATIEDVLGAACACQARRTYRYLVELVCTLCSRTVATAVIAEPGAPIRVPRQLRCSHCGGQPMTGETFRQVVYPSVPREQPRRGRPPQWLVDQRRLERSAS